MSDDLNIESPVPAAELDQAAAAASNTEELIQKIDDAVAAIEVAQKSSVPFDDALKAARKDFENLNAASAKSEKAEVKQTYAQAIVLAQQLVASAQEQGKVVADSVIKLQDELEILLAELREKDPENPLIKTL